MSSVTPDVTGSARKKVTAALTRREIVILVLVGSLLFISALVIQGRVTAETTGVLLRGLQDLGLSFIEAALIMVVIELRASREQIEQSLGLIERATAESKRLIGESIDETRRAAEQSQRMTREAIDSVFKSVYQKNVPQELVEHYETSVFQRKFFKREDEYIYTLTVPERAKPDDPMQVHVYHKFKMFNLTSEELEYELRCETSLPSYEPQNSTSRYFDLKVDRRPFAEGKLETVRKPGYKALMLTQKIPIPRNSSRLIEVSWTMVRRVRDTEVLQAGWPSDGVTVHVNYDRTLEVTANALHPTSLSDAVTGTRSSKWSLVGGMIEGQGVYISWEPKV